ncbi:uncharacterized protein LOC111618605 [Centruroides sculpturatus]|uniref:uncharacterized protein LOC111618605 n=1 Tax=Centruroides sculpturatus TaxID=218467 RepID=UPI000C6E5D74|nr:uncharacterized protein LOC111618605 [Centruroides sculpturatus]
MTLTLKLIIICLFLFTQTFSMSEIQSEGTIENDEELKKMWSNTLENLKFITKVIVKFIQPRIKRIAKEINITQECKESFKQFLYGLQNNKIWAFKMFDSWGKLPVGHFGGTLTDFGSYYQCKHLVDDVKKTFNTDWKNFSPRYCILDYRLPPPSVGKDISSYDTVPDFLNITDKDSVQNNLVSYAHVYLQHAIRVGICVPSSCTFLSRV